jgi:predicted permease
MPFLHGLGLNGRVIAFAGGLTVLATALFAFIPMVRMRFGDIRAGLSDAGRASTGVAWRRFGSNLVVAELAMAMVLLAGAGLLGKSLYRLLHTDIGMEPDHIAMVRVNTLPEKYGKPDQRVALGRQIVSRIANLPGVKAAGITTKLPIEDADYTTGFRIVGKPDYGEHREVAIRFVTPGYMATLKTRLLGGRYFTDDEDSSKPGVVIINQALAKQYFPGEDPVGRQLALNGDKAKPMLIVGLISDIQEGQLDAAPRGAMYLPFYQDASTNFIVLVRTTQPERTLLPALMSALHEIDGTMAIYDPITMEQKIHDAPSTYLHRSAAWLVGGFAFIAFLLGVVGLYGVIAYGVSQRTREIGVRMALGAERVAVYRLVMREAGQLIAAGIVIGVAASVGTAMLMGKLLFGVQAWDGATLAAVAVVLGAFSLLASYMPARRAASVSPAEALRAE